jgi:hypothetical protein
MGDQKRISFARIRLNQSQQESFEISKKILDLLDLQKWKEKTINDDKQYIFCRPKMGFIKNKVTNNFYIMAKPEGSNSVIDIYFDLVTFGVVTGQVIDPFYKKLCDELSENPTIEISIIESITYEEIEATSNEEIHSDNISNSVHSVADEIAKISKLRSEDSISEEEFQKMKNELIDKM